MSPRLCKWHFHCISTCICQINLAFYKIEKENSRDVCLKAHWRICHNMWHIIKLWSAGISAVWMIPSITNFHSMHRRACQKQIRLVMQHVELQLIYTSPVHHITKPTNWLIFDNSQIKLCSHASPNIQCKFLNWSFLWSRTSRTQTPYRFSACTKVDDYCLLMYHLWASATWKQNKCVSCQRDVLSVSINGLRAGAEDLAMWGSAQRSPGPDSQTQGKWAPLPRWPCWVWEIGLALIACVWNKWEMWFPEAWDSRAGTTDHYTLTSPAQWRWQGHGAPEETNDGVCARWEREYICVFVLVYKGQSCV